MRKEAKFWVSWPGCCIFLWEEGRFQSERWLLSFNESLIQGNRMKESVLVHGIVKSLWWMIVTIQWSCLKEKSTPLLVIFNIWMWRNKRRLFCAFLLGRGRLHQIFFHISFLIFCIPIPLSKVLSLDGFLPQQWFWWNKTKLFFLLIIKI